MYYQMFALQQVVEKGLEKRKKVYAAFIHLEKAYDEVNKEAFWEVLTLYCLHGRLITAVKSLNNGRSVRLIGSISEWLK